RTTQQIGAALELFRGLLGTIPFPRQGSSEKITAHLKTRGESALPGQQDNHHCGLSAQVNQNGARRVRSAGPVCSNQSIRSGGDLAQIFLLKPEAPNTLADVPLLAERDPELLPIFGRRFDADKVINNSALADASKPNRFIFDEFFDFAFRREWHVNDLGS